MSLLSRGLLLFLCSQFAASVMAAPEFPALSGRVVDQAVLLSNNTERELSKLSAAHEKATGNQVVVATVADLQGYSVEEFGYQLGRHWGIGQKDKNNGVLLLVAKAERKVRIEVGYGLEGSLTDAVASNIIHQVITPAYKRAQFDKGTINGTRSIIEALGGKYQPANRKRSKDSSSPIWNIVLFLLFFVFIPGLFGRRSFLWALLLGSGMSGRSGRGGFGGGGGSFGGGGASGGW